jgi:hypothetical protein
MTIPESVRTLVATGPLAHLTTLNSDGSPQVTVVWVAIEGDAIVSAHLPPDKVGFIPHGGKGCSDVLCLFPDVHRSLWGDLVSHADRAGWNPEADGAMEYSATGGRIHRPNWLKAGRGNLLPDSRFSVIRVMK